MIVSAFSQARPRSSNDGESDSHENSIQYHPKINVRAHSNQFIPSKTYPPANHVILKKCSKDEIRNYDGSCATPTINRRVFTFIAPPVEVTVEKAKNVPDPSLDLNVLFVETPSTNFKPQPIIVTAAQQKTIVYLLSKEQTVQQKVIEFPYSKPEDPSVYFVNYKEGSDPFKDGSNPFENGDIDVRTVFNQDSSSSASETNLEQENKISSLESSPAEDVKISTLESSPAEDVKISTLESSPAEDVKISYLPSSPVQDVTTSYLPSSPAVDVRISSLESSAVEDVKISSS